MESLLEQFMGKPGEPVAQVDPEDLKALWKVLCECKQSGESATGVEILKYILKAWSRLLGSFLSRYRDSGISFR